MFSFAEERCLDPPPVSAGSARAGPPIPSRPAGTADMNYPRYTGGDDLLSATFQRSMLLSLHSLIHHIPVPFTNIRPDPDTRRVLI